MSLLSQQTNSRYTCNPQCQTWQRYSSARSSNGTEWNVSFSFWPWDGVLNLMSYIQSPSTHISLCGFSCIDFYHVSIFLETSAPHHKATNHYYYSVVLFFLGLIPVVNLPISTVCQLKVHAICSLYMLFFHLSTYCFILFYMHKLV